MNISVVTDITDEIVEAFERLVPQLAYSAPPPGREELARIVGTPGTTLFIARDELHRNDIVGTLTLVVYHIPTGCRAWIEDVVVDSGARGKGVGEALCRAALDRAQTAGAASVNLTSNPTREAANRLYQRMGFERRETNVYRYSLGAR